MNLGLRIDVDTHDGMRDGVPSIRRTLDKYGFRGSFFFSFGPDNSGKAVLRAFTKPGFVSKMFRTNAASMYGVRTALSGTLLPARWIAKKFPELARECKQSGHEVGVHAWDHVAWQDHLHQWDVTKTRAEFGKAAAAFEEIFGERTAASAAPAWFASPESIAVQDEFGLDYCSDCRSTDPGVDGAFLPVWNGKNYKTPQVPAGIPTLDEDLGRDGRTLEIITKEWLFAAAARPLAVATIHAEAEGRMYAPWFDDLCKQMKGRKQSFTTTREILNLSILNAKKAAGELPRREMSLANIPGRAGKVAFVG
ncbi:MAG: 4-deoxy-4-formamido-L-arabinose-phosphoundecaprenol deformylase [Planctomycetes bacterium]|nr:4-deoxy-4-formamido-L-arabinose-phosphoundecaprenol deformylase [Planctomycetota bacterium]